MRRVYLLTGVFLSVFLPGSGISWALPGMPCPCPEKDRAYVIMAEDTPMAAMPGFLTCGQVEVDSLFVCEHGIFFFFLEDSVIWSVGVPTPTTQRYQKYRQFFLPDSIMAERNIFDPLIPYVIADLESSHKFVLSLMSCLGIGFARDKFIKLDAATLYFDHPLILRIKEKSMELRGIPEIYRYERRKNHLTP